MNVVDALAQPESYPCRPAAVQVRETHISWVFLAGERAYKLKKPLVLDFLGRELDVSDDLAFLVLDLAALGGERFCDPLVGAYRDSGGDSGDEPLIAFYAAYRALVRAKVALVRAGQLPRGSSELSREVRAHATWWRSRSDLPGGRDCRL